MPSHNGPEVRWGKHRGGGHNGPQLGFILKAIGSHRRIPTREGYKEMCILGRPRSALAEWIGGTRLACQRPPGLLRGGMVWPELG